MHGPPAKFYMGAKESGAIEMVILDKKLPWFMLYANDFIVKTVGLTNAQVGIYIKLLAYTWAYGPLPNDLKVINSIVQGGKATQLVLDRFFETDEEGKLREPSLDVMRNEALEKAEVNRKRTAAATEAAKEAKAEIAKAKAELEKAKLTVAEPSRNRKRSVTVPEIELRGNSGELQKDSKLQKNGNAQLEAQAKNPPDVVSTLPVKPSGTPIEKSLIGKLDHREWSPEQQANFDRLHSIQQKYA